MKHQLQQHKNMRRFPWWQRSNNNMLQQQQQVATNLDPTAPSVTDHKILLRHLQEGEEEVIEALSRAITRSRRKDDASWLSVSGMVLSQLFQKYGRVALVTAQFGLGWFLLSKIVKELSWLEQNDDLYCHSASKEKLDRLANKLVRAGMVDETPTADSTGRNSVQEVLKKLTKNQAQLLERILYIPPLNTAMSQVLEDIVGHEDIKESLLDTVSLLHQTDLVQEENACWSKLVKPPLGILLYGPPGCGKSMLVRALSSTGLPTLCVSPSHLLDKYIGETNKAVRNLFEIAQLLAPCIVCIEEMDGLFRERSLQEHDVSREMKTEFLSLWDGVQDSSKPILILGTSNRPFDMDSAVLRRMPVSFLVGLPNDNMRHDLIAKLLQGIPMEKHSPTCGNYAPQIVADLVHDTEGFSCSDVVQLLRSAVTMGPVRQARLQDSSLFRPLSRQDFQRAMAQQMRPTPMTPQYQTALQSFMQTRSSSSSTATTTPRNDNAVFYNMGTLSAPYYVDTTTTGQDPDATSTSSSTTKEASTFSLETQDDQIDESLSLEEDWSEDLYDDDDESDDVTQDENDED